MDRSLKLKLGAGVAAAAAAAGGGAAIAADRLGPSDDSQAVVNDAAKQLGVTPSALTAALKKALENRVDEAVAAGRLTQEQGQELKQRIESGDLPLFFGPRGGPPEHFGELDAAVAAGRLTKAQEQQILAGLKDRITAFVNGMRDHDFRFDRGFAGPPPGYHAA